MKKMKQTLNTQFRRDSKLDVGPWTLDAGCFQLGLR